MAPHWLLGLGLRSTAVLLAALGLEHLLRRTTALARHRLLTLTAIGLLALPALPELLPRWDVSFLPAWIGSIRDPNLALAHAAMPPPADRALTQTPSTVARTGDTQRPGEGTHPHLPSFADALMGLWLVGAATSLLSLARGLQRDRRLLAASRPLQGAWEEALVEVTRSLAIRGAVRLLTNESIDTPLTGGWIRPAVLLPEAATSWTPERQRVVLQHELVHVVRGDGLRHLAWRLVGALYWFHPLVRLAARRASVAREEACDEAVLDLGNRPSVYARHLLGIAESLSVEPVSLASALPMVDRSQLERRLVVILDPNRSSRRGRLLAAAALVVVVSMVFGVGAAAPRPDPASAAAKALPAVAVLLPDAATPPGATASEPGPACVDLDHGNFEGTLNEGPSGTDAVGVHDGDFIVQQRFADRHRLCARAHGAIRFDEGNGSILELPPESWMQVETDSGRGSLRMLVTADGSEPRYQWWRNGHAQAVDAAARAWFSAAIQAVAGYRQIGELQGKVGSLQGDIGSIQGEVGSLQGEIGSIQGQEGTLQGKLGAIQGEMGRLQGEIGSHEGAIGSLQGSRFGADVAKLARIERDIRSHQAAISSVQAVIAIRNLTAQIAAAEKDIRTFVDSEARGRIAEIERQIRDVRAEERIARLEREIRDLHVDERVAEIERRIKPAIEGLKSEY